jgi:hypothetical protein
VLNFDPRQWLVEHAGDANAPFVATVATVAATSPELKNMRPGAKWVESQKQVLNLYPATVATVSGWARELSRLDPCQPPNGFSMGRWQTLYDDALWLLDGFGEQVAREGWSDADLFGLWPGKPSLGGIADRLGGSRSLAMDADQAIWRSWGQVELYARGVYPHLKPFWKRQADDR